MPSARAEVHIALTTAALVIFALAFWVSGVPELIEAHGRSLVFGSPMSWPQFPRIRSLKTALEPLLPSGGRSALRTAKSQPVSRSVAWSRSRPAGIASRPAGHVTPAPKRPKTAVWEPSLRPQSASGVAERPSASGLVPQRRQLRECKSAPIVHDQRG